jgi:hypothetical protein
LLFVLTTRRTEFEFELVEVLDELDEELTEEFEADDAWDEGSLKSNG